MLLKVLCLTVLLAGFTAGQGSFTYSVVNDLTEFPPIFSGSTSFQIVGDQPLLAYMAQAARKDGGYFDKYELRYYSSVPGYYVTAIYGVVSKYPTLNTYWELYNNDVAIGPGVSQFKPKDGDRVLFKFVKSSAAPFPYK